MSSSQCTHLIVCLGGGVNDDGSLPDHVRSRVQCAVDVGKLDNKAVLIFSSSFTLNKRPKMNSSGYPISEASSMYTYAKSLKYRGHAYCEQQSHDTIGSAYFIFSDFVSFLTPTKISVITSDFHIERSAFIYSHLALLFGYRGELSFKITPSSVSKSRLNKEKISLEKYISHWRPISNVNDFRNKFFNHHNNYNFVFSSGVEQDDVLVSY